MNNNNRNTTRRPYGKSGPQYSKNTSGARGSQSAPPAKKHKKKSGLRIGGFIIRPRLIALLLVIAVAVGIIISVSSQKPEFYEINRSSITVFEDTKAIIIKDESGYSYPEGVSIISRVKDGTFVNAGDEIAIVKTSSFNDDWYAQLEIARRNTINYMLEHLDNENEVLQNALEIIDSQIKAISEEMINTVSLQPSSYTEYSKKLHALYIEKRDIVLSVFGTDQNINDYLNKEGVIQDKIDSCTQSIVAMKTGIISYNSDGYANIYNYSNIDAVTETAFNNILNDSYSASIKNSRSACDYFISNMNKCYIVMEGDGATLKYLQINDEAILRLNQGMSQCIATIRKAEHNAANSFIIAEPTGSFSELYRTRELVVSVQKTWAGLVVPKEHIIKKKDSYGVYVYADGKQIFTPITVLAENDNVVVLDTSSVDNIFKQGTLIVKQ